MFTATNSSRSSGAYGRGLVAAFAALLFAGQAAFCGAAPDPVEVAAYRVASALAEGVAISLHDSPQDERGLVMIGNRLDDVVVKLIQRSPATSRAFVDDVAARHPLSPETRDYIAGALIGFSQICEDFPAAVDREIDPVLLELITAFRRGVKAGVETARSDGGR